MNIPIGLLISDNTLVDTFGLLYLCVLLINGTKRSMNIFLPTLVSIGPVVTQKKINNRRHIWASGFICVLPINKQNYMNILEFGCNLPRILKCGSNMQHNDRRRCRESNICPGTRSCVRPSVRPSVKSMHGNHKAYLHH